MSNFAAQRVLSVHHWSETLFSFRTTRDPACASSTANS
jgi:ferredoxin--NADP+ reductase